jgi:hypothetical protein
VTKSDIINALAAKHGFRRYLEICTPTTGTEFAKIDRGILPFAHRLMYACPFSHTEELPIDYRTRDRSSNKIIDMMVKTFRAPFYEIALVDSYHSYECSIRDLIGASLVLRENGIVVVHDCAPDDPELSQPEFRAGRWFGVSYAAFIDFVLQRRDIAYYTVGTDSGCGVIFKNPGLSAFAPPAIDRDKLEFEWRCATGEAERYAVYEQHRAALLNLISPDEFLAVEGLSAPGQ